MLSSILDEQKLKGILVLDTVRQITTDEALQETRMFHTYTYKLVTEDSKHRTGKKEPESLQVHCKLGFANTLENT